MTKSWWMSLAEVSDALRLMPRFMLWTLTILYAILVYLAWQWFATAEWEMYNQSTVSALLAFPGAILTILGGILMKIFLEYMRTGRDWEKAKENPEPEEARCPECHKEYG